MAVNRKLTALEYTNADKININNDQEFRKIVGWLEQYKIKQAPNDVATILLNINSNDWNKAYEKYKNNLNCPQNLMRELDWIAGVAIKRTYSANKTKFNKNAVENLKATNVPNIVTDNPLDVLDFTTNEFVNGIKNLARILKVSPYPDPMVTLEACRKVIETKMHPAALANPKDFIIKGTPFPYHNADLGFDLGDVALNHAAKILRLLYIHDLRDLQTSANEVIVSVQNITANPKTDTKLGKVGR
ncbi:RNA transcription, translation and transport factor protein [Popillia japonica]|uniref:RNA transcription, translation and transport factor protein n=1 Tax=Popillia japonica TaxID=7064 RepID=A0AAW1N3P7_POPJA